LVNLVVTVVFGVAAIWAFRRLASVARIERGTIPS
jgi:hypothetical protein